MCKEQGGQTAVSVKALLMEELGTCSFCSDVAE